MIGEYVIPTSASADATTTLLKQGIAALKRDLAAKLSLVQRRRRHQAVIEDILTGVLPPT